MVKLNFYDKEIHDDIEKMVCDFLISKNISEGDHVISFPQECMNIKLINQAIGSVYFDTYFSLTPEYKLEFFYIIVNDEQIKKIK
jgi:hypothetical protein